MLIDRNLYDRISDITDVDYLQMCLMKEEMFVKLSDSQVNSMLNDLLDKIDLLNKEIKDIKIDIESNYRPISKQEQIGYNENW